MVYQKFLMIILFLLFIIPLTTTSQITFNENNIPMIEINNTPLIYNIQGYYIDSNGTVKNGRIIDFNGTDVIFDYTLISKPGKSIFTHQVDILDLNINYTIKNDFRSMIPFEFDLGEWPEFLYILDDNLNTKIKNGTSIAGNSSLWIYGKNKSIQFSKLPIPFGYLIEKQSEYTKISIVGKNVSKEGRLDIEINVTEYTPLELVTVNSFTEKSVITQENGSIRIQTDYYKDFDLPISYIRYFGDPWKSDDFFIKAFSNFKSGTYFPSNWSSTSITNDSDMLLLIPPFPNVIIEPDSAIIFDPLQFQSGDLVGYGFRTSPFQWQRLSIDNYEIGIDILNLDRLIFYAYQEPEITIFPNKSSIYWNLSKIESPLALFGLGPTIVILQPESKMYISTENLKILPPINEADPPDTFEIVKQDIRSPLKSGLPIPLFLDTSSDANIDMKVNGNNLKGPYEWNQNLFLEEDKYYTIKGFENSTTILFAMNTSNDITIDLKYTQNAIKNIEKINSYTWKYSLYERYPVGDIPNYKQIYNIVLPSQYSFSDFPSNAKRQRTIDGKDQIILEYNQSVRYRYINFSISSEHLKEEAFPKNLTKFLSWSWMAENIGLLILVLLISIIIAWLNRNSKIFRKFKDKIDEIKK